MSCMHCLRRLSQGPFSILASSQLFLPASILGCDNPTRLRHVRGTFELSQGQQVLQYWQALLGNSGGANVSKSNRNHVTANRKTEDIRDLLHIAIRVRQGRVSGVLPEQLMSTFVQVYRKAMNAEDRLRLFQLLCKDFGVQGAEVDKAVENWKQAASRGDEAVLRSVEQLQQASQPLYNNLFLPFSNQPDGIKFLVDMRADVRQAVKLCPATAGPLRALDRSLRQSLATWFSVGLLQLQAISWDSSPASLLEKVMLYEAVHPIQGWPDLHQRLGPMRRVHAFMHPSMPQEPLVILHCAIQRGAAASMNDILHPQQMQPAHPAAVNPEEDTASKASEVTDMQKANTAVFYSISSTQKGLAEINLGNFLIKQVAKRVITEFPSVDTLITLSPIPGFRNWLHTQVEAESTALHQDGGVGRLALSILTDDEVLHVNNMFKANASINSRLAALDHLAALIEQQDNPSTQQSAMLSLQAWKKLLMRLCAEYLLHVRRRRLAFDPVENFHLRNGASIWRLNWAADLSLSGLKTSFGIMVNYQYELENVQNNSHSYLMDGKVHSSSQIQQMVSVEQQA
ncbi:hypothetical protein ABBQ32_009392 [Trebouxia sp. C0010 RCD-2024]